VIDQLDILLRKLVTSSVTGFGSDDQVRFQPPDEDWRTYVKNLTIGANHVNALNFYLVDLRENRKLRSNERQRSLVNGDIVETQAPRRIDCHYLISAWSPGEITPAIEPTLDEHAVLYQVAQVFSQHDPLVAAAIYAPGPVPGTFPPALIEEPMPITLLPSEGFIKLAEFWGTMGHHQARWRPVVYLVVTLPIPAPARISGAMVTAAMAEVLVTGVPASAESVIDFGGTVRNAQAQAVSGAWVELIGPAGARLPLTRCDADGHFIFAGIAAGTYTLRASSHSAGPVSRTVQVPSPTGEYDLQL
jgi:hypothetical protein